MTVNGAEVLAPAGLRAGEVAAAAGVNLQTLRYYERRGLLAAPARTTGGHRLYPPETVSRLRSIKAAQRLGFTLAEIVGLLRPGRGDLQKQTAHKLAEVDARIAELTAARDTLQAALHAGCRDLDTCAHTPRCPLRIAAPGTSGP